MNMEDRNILVAGCGISGIAAANLLASRGISCTLYDGNEKLDKEKITQNLLDTARTSLLLGKLDKETVQRTQTLVLSPGIATDSEWVEEFRREGIPIIGEIELAYRMGAGKVIGITGTNGKTTTTSLTGAIMRKHFEHVFVVGNIGIPYTQVAEQLTRDSVTVAEISSFQLETIDTFCPQVSAVLNVTPDHLDRHHTMDNYIQAKADIARNQTSEQACVLNYDNDITRKMAQTVNARVVFFSRKEALKEGVCLSGKSIVHVHNSKKHVICELSDMQLVGDCNVENVMAAAAIALQMGVTYEEIREAVREFKAVEHRIEYVAQVNGVRYYNDSKGTNPDAAIQGIKAMDRPTVLLAGGYDKKASYGQWLEACAGKVKALVLIGETREQIACEAGKHHISNIILKDTFEEAMDECVRQASEGDAVLLSPACASWGMFKNYEQRGEIFKQYVKSL